MSATVGEHVRHLSQNMEDLGLIPVTSRYFAGQMTTYTSDCLSLGDKSSSQWQPKKLWDIDKWSSLSLYQFREFLSRLIWLSCCTWDSFNNPLSLAERIDCTQ